MFGIVFVLLGLFVFGGLWLLLTVADASRRVDLVIALVLDDRGEDD